MQTLCDLGCGSGRTKALLAYPMRPGEEHFAAAAAVASLDVREVGRRKGSAGRDVSIIEVAARVGPSDTSVSSKTGGPQGGQ